MEVTLFGITVGATFGTMIALSLAIGWTSVRRSTFLTACGLVGLALILHSILIIPRPVAPSTTITAMGAGIASFWAAFGLLAALLPLITGRAGANR